LAPLATTVAALFTSAVAIGIALFKDNYERWRRRPDLRFSLMLHPPHAHLTRYSNGDPVYYLRFWVENENGKGRAEDLELAITDLYKLSGAQPERVAGFIPTNLRWSGKVVPVGTVLVPVARLDSLAAGVSCHCDFGHIHNNTLLDHLVFALDVEFESNTFTHRLLPGRYLFCARLVAANSKPIRKWYELDWTGKWSDDEADMLERNITIVPSHAPEDRP
jgi:hypothetical protein